MSVPISWAVFPKPPPGAAGAKDCGAPCQKLLSSGAQCVANHVLNCLLNDAAEMPMLLPSTAARSTKVQLLGIIINHLRKHRNPALAVDIAICFSMPLNVLEYWIRLCGKDLERSGNVTTSLDTPFCNKYHDFRAQDTRPPNGEPPNPGFAPHLCVAFACQPRTCWSMLQDASSSSEFNL